MDKTLYKTLGVSEDATEKEIKNAFRKKALKYHPDKNPDKEDKFKEINAAYEILGDKEKRRKYDQFGASAFDNSSNQRYYRNGNEFHMNMEEILKEMFGGVFGNRNHFHQHRPSNLDVTYKIGISLSMAVNGGTVVIDVEGQQIKLKIPVGVKNKSKLRIAGKGRKFNNKAGDLYIIIIIEPEKGYSLEGNDIFTNDNIDLKTAIFGGVKSFDFFGESITYKVPKNTKPGQKLRLQKGLSGGSTYISVKVDLPKAEERPDLESIL